MMQGLADAHVGSRQREHILGMLDAMGEEADGAADVLDPRDYYVSKSWLM